MPVRANDPMNAAIDVGFMTGVLEIWGPDSQLYGFIITQELDTVSTRLVDENTLRVRYYRYEGKRGQIFDIDKMKLLCK